MMRLFKYIVILALATASCSPPASVLVNSGDLPPSPFSLPASTGPKSASYLRDAGRALELHAATTNAAVKQLLVEIRDMSQRLAVLETNAWQKDPLLLTCDRYIEKAHDWVMAKHHAEIKAESAAFYSTNQTVAGALQKTENELSGMMNLILLKELGGNPNFTPLIKSAYDLLEPFYRQNPGAASRSDVYGYRRYDRLIGYRDTRASTVDFSFTNVQSQVGKRYLLLTAKVAQIQREQHLPPAAVAGLKYSQLYRMLDGCAELYLDGRTPPEVRQLREDLSRKLVDLSWLDK